MSEYRPRPGDVFLGLGHWNSAEAAYQMTERYRIIQLPAEYTANDLAGDSLTSQLEDIARIRLNVLKRELPTLQLEQKELEDFMK